MTLQCNATSILANGAVRCTIRTSFGCPSIYVTADYGDQSTVAGYLGRGIYGLPVPSFLPPSLPVTNTISGQGYYALNTEFGSATSVSGVEFYVSNPGYIQILVGIKYTGRYNHKLKADLKS